VGVRVDLERLGELDLENREAGQVDADRDRPVLTFEALAVAGAADHRVHWGIV